MKFKALTVSILSCILMCCDPIHTIDITNNSSSDVMIEVKLRENYLEYIVENQPSGDSLAIQLHKGETESLYFGIGTWSDIEVSDLASLVQEVKVSSDSSTFRTSSTNYLYKLLIDHREGRWWKTRIHLEIE